MDDSFLLQQLIKYKIPWTYLSKVFWPIYLGHNPRPEAVAHEHSEGAT